MVNALHVLVLVKLVKIKSLAVYLAFKVINWMAKLAAQMVILCKTEIAFKHKLEIRNVTNHV